MTAELSMAGGLGAGGGRIRELTIFYYPLDTKDPEIGDGFEKEGVKGGGVYVYTFP